MLGSLSTYEPQLYALMRIVTGLLFLCHGSQKLFGFPGTLPGADRGRSPV